MKGEDQLHAGIGGRLTRANSGIAAALSLAIAARETRPRPARRVPILVVYRLPHIKIDASSVQAGG